MPELASYLDIRQALQEKTPEILQQIPVSIVRLSLSLDGRGARICASVRINERARVPSEVNVVLDGRKITIQVVPVENYDEYESYRWIVDHLFCLKMSVQITPTSIRL